MVQQQSKANQIQVSAPIFKFMLEITLTNIRTKVYEYVERWAHLLPAESRECLVLKGM